MGIFLQAQSTLYDLRPPDERAFFPRVINTRTGQHHREDRIMRKTLIVASGVSLALAMAAAAQQGTPRTDTSPNASQNAGSSSSMAGSASAGAAQFGDMDQNRDGRISQSEVESYTRNLNNAFSKLDTNNDKYLSQTEFGKWDAKASGMPDSRERSSSQSPRDTSSRDSSRPGSTDSPSDSRSTTPGGAR